MREISKVREFSGEDIHLPLKEQISDIPIEKKEDVLKYLKSFSANCAAGTYLVDEILGDNIDTCILGYEDGKYYWDAREVYHFEKYNLRLNPEFISYVLNQ